MTYQDILRVSIERLKEVPSTNEYLSQLCRQGKTEEYHTVVADAQTAGKGQRGNSWESEPGKNLTFSTVLYPTTLEARKQFILSMMTAVAAINTLETYAKGFSIKWPNDIYWKDRKIGGILIENELEGKYINQSILGVGLNINQREFHSDAPNPVSLYQIIGTEIDCNEVLDRFLHSLIAIYRHTEDLEDESISTLSDLYSMSLYRKEGLYPYRDARGEFRAEIAHVELNGRLHLKDEKGEIRAYTFKEVSFILPHE